VSVNHGANQSFTITPNSGYHVDSVVVDGANQGAIANYNFLNVTANHTIAAYFSINTYTITATASAGGSIAPSGAVSVNHGANQSFTITPNSGYHIDSVVVDGVNQGAITNYDFLNVTANHTIAAYFSINAYTITATASAGGSIAPSGSVSVNHGANQSFTITPNSGYHIDSVVVDGANQGAIANYDFLNVTANHTIAAYFSISNFTITASATGGGSIAPSGSVGVTSGANQLFAITPNPGYHIDSVVVDGVDQGTIANYTFTNVLANHTIAAYFSINVYTIVASAGPNGSIAPSGSIMVNYGSNQSFAVTPDPTYHIDSVVVNGVNQGPVASYDFINITANHAITAYFSLNAYTITATAVGGGSIAPSGSVSVSHGANQSFTITPNSGDHIDSVVVDGVNQGAVSGYSFLNVTASHTITAYFSIDTYTILASASAGGSIAPSGAVVVNSGANQLFTIAPNSGYHIDSVVVDGANQGTVANYNFLNVTANHTIAAYFSIQIYTITATAVGSGSIAPSGIIAVTHGGNQGFTIAPDFYHHIDSVVIDGSNAGTITSHTFTNVMANHSITAYFTIDYITFLTVTPDTLFNENPEKPGKSKRPARRGKNQIANWSNLFDETVVQGGFAPGTSESDSGGGAIVGVSHVYRRSASPIYPKWTPVKDSSKIRTWVRLSKWSFKRQAGTGFIGKGYKEFQRTLRDKTGKHTGPTGGLDSTTDSKNKRLYKQFKRLYPRKHNNKLFAELIALKMNIATSQLGKTPAGFGDLIFDVDGNIFDEMSILQISEKADTLMTYWQGHVQEEYDSLYSAVAAINRAFVGPFDTLSFETQDSFFVNGKLVLKGQVAIGDVPFMKLPIPFVPTRIFAQNADVESEDEPDENDDFDDSDLDHDEEDEIPLAARLFQNFPNPFNPSTRIGFRLGEASLVTVKVYNILGQEIGVLIDNEEFDEGFNSVEFVANGNSTGTYFYRIEAQGLEEEGLRTVETKKMLLLR
ncbi:MAG: InlB B-repeat-containing protein, partial [Bacteroidota bacterium]